MVEEGEWTMRTQSFSPAQSSGKLKLEMLCPRATTVNGFWEVAVDSVSLSDAATE